MLNDILLDEFQHWLKEKYLKVKNFSSKEGGMLLTNNFLLLKA